MPIISFFLSPLGRWIGIALVVMAAIGGVYTKGRVDGRTAYKAKIERQIEDAKLKGDTAREKALRDFDAAPDDGLPDDGFRRP
jgi:hypothetical protein